MTKGNDIKTPGMRKQRCAIAAVSLAAGMATLDTSMTNTALPSMAAELQAAPSAVIGVVTIYQLVMVAAMLPLAAIGNKLSHRTVFLYGLAVFLVASLWCGLATSLWSLEAARALQGLGAAAIMGGNIALVKHLYAPNQLGKGLGFNALVIALCLAGGPVAASALLSVTSWHWLFLINIPIGLVAAAFALSALPADQPTQTTVDALSAGLCMLALGGLIAGIEALAHRSHSSYAVLAASFLSLYCLVRRERDRASPIFPMDLLRRPVFRRGVIALVCAFATQGAALVALPFLLKNSMGRSIAEIGFLIAPWPVMGALLGPVAGALSDRISAQWLSGIGLACLAAGTLSLGTMALNASTLCIVGSVAMCGVGFGLFLSPSQRVLVASVPATRSGSAGGLIGLARLFGQATGACMVAWCLASKNGQGEQLALIAGAVLAAVGSVLSFQRFRTDATAVG